MPMELISMSLLISQEPWLRKHHLFNNNHLNTWKLDSTYHWTSKLAATGALWHHRQRRPALVCARPTHRQQQRQSEHCRLYLPGELLAGAEH